MFFTLLIKKVSSNLFVFNRGYVNTDLNEEESVGSWRFLVFGIEVADEYHLDLKTGEIFQSCARAKSKGQEDKQITASLAIINYGNINNTAKSERNWNILRYDKATTGTSDGVLPATKSSLYFKYHFSENDFSLLYSSIISGHVPKSITVEFGNSIVDKTKKNIEYRMKYGYEWDGDGLVWDNDVDHIPIEGLHINFDHYSKND